MPEGLLQNEPLGSVIVHYQQCVLFCFQNDPAALGPRRSSTLVVRDEPDKAQHPGLRGGFVGNSARMNRGALNSELNFFAIHNHLLRRIDAEFTMSLSTLRTFTTIV